MCVLFWWKAFEYTQLGVTPEKLFSTLKIMFFSFQNCMNTLIFMLYFLWNSVRMLHHSHLLFADFRFNHLQKRQSKMSFMHRILWKQELPDFKTKSLKLKIKKRKKSSLTKICWRTGINLYVSAYMLIYTYSYNCNYKHKHI